MTVFKYFIKSALRLKWIIIVYTFIFFFFSIINGGNTDSKEIQFMESNIDIGIVDESNSPLSKELIVYLSDHNTIVHMVNDLDLIKDQIFLEEVDAVVIIPKDFEFLVKNKEKSMEIIRDDRKMGALQIENELNKFLAFANAKSTNGEFDLLGVRDALNNEVEVEVLKDEKTSSSTGTSIWFQYYFNFTSFVIVAIYIAVIGLVMTDFNNKNIQDRVKISSKTFLGFNREMYLGQVVIGLLITTVFVLGSLALKGKLILQVDFLKHVINVYVFSFAILCFTFLINNLTSSRFVINGISTVASLGTAFISGVMVPQEFLGEKVLNIAKFFPTYYFVRINERKISSYGDIRYELLMQVLFGVVFLSLGLYFGKIRQKS